MLQISDHKAGVAAEHLIAALPTKNDLHVLGSQLGNHELRKRAWTGHGEIEMIDDLSDILLEIARLDVQNIERRTCALRREFRKSTLVISRVFEETSMKSFVARSGCPAGQNRHDAGIDATRKITANRHIAAQMKFDAVQKTGSHFLPHRLRIEIILQIVIDVPIAPNSQPAFLDDQGMSRHELGDAAKHRLLAKRILESQIFGQSAGIRVDLRKERQQSLGFRREKELVLLNRIIERLYAERIARAKKPSALLIPKRESEHPAEMANAVIAPSRIGGQDGFRVAMRPEIPTAGQFFFQLEIIVYLAIENDA